MQVRNVLHVAQWKLHTIVHHCTTLSDHIFTTKACTDNWKKSCWTARSPPQPILIGFTSWLLYGTDVAQQRPTKSCTMFGHALKRLWVMLLYYRPLTQFCKWYSDCHRVPTNRENLENESKHSEMGPVRQKPVRSVHLYVHCTVHNCCTQYCTEQTW